MVCNLQVQKCAAVNYWNYNYIGTVIVILELLCILELSVVFIFDQAVSYGNYSFLFTLNKLLVKFCCCFLLQGPNESFLEGHIIPSFPTDILCHSTSLPSGKRCGLTPSPCPEASWTS